MERNLRATRRDPRAFWPAARLMGLVNGMFWMLIVLRADTENDLALVRSAWFGDTGQGIRTE
jgi:hypothetical protein